jgi:hypothetical protein
MLWNLLLSFLRQQLKHLENCAQRDECRLVMRDEDLEAFEREQKRLNARCGKCGLPVKRIKSSFKYTMESPLRPRSRDYDSYCRNCGCSLSDTYSLDGRGMSPLKDLCDDMMRSLRNDFWSWVMVAVFMGLLAWGLFFDFRGF